MSRSGPKSRGSGRNLRQVSPLIDILGEIVSSFGLTPSGRPPFWPSPYINRKFHPNPLPGSCPASAWACGRQLKELTGKAALFRRDPCR
jgi:hypothetical protein